MAKFTVSVAWAAYPAAHLAAYLAAHLAAYLDT
jgi:hypothetical protein